MRAGCDILPNRACERRDSMAVDLSVVVWVERDQSLRELVRSIDGQSLPNSRFELFLVDDGLDPTARKSIDRLAERRTNVRVARVDEDWPRMLSDGYVLQLDPGQQLFPQTLRRLLEFAGEHQLDIVAGRQVSLSRPVPAVLLVDNPLLEGEQAAAALTGPVRLIRRNRVAVRHRVVDVQADGARVGSFASYPSSLRREEPEEPGPVVTVSASALRWVDREIVLELSGTVAAADDNLAPYLLLRRLGTDETYVLIAEGSVTAAGDDQGRRVWSASTSIAPLSAAAGAPLAPGEWRVDAVLAGPTEASVPARVPESTSSSGLVGQLAIVANGQRDGILHLDVGPTRHPLISSVTADKATVIETAGGSVLEIALPDCHVASDESFDGFIGLGPLRLPAVIRTSSTRAVLTAYVSGLAGSYPLSASFGRCSLQPIGLTLEISGVGAMEVVRTKVALAPAEPAKAKRSSASKQARRRKSARRRRRAAAKRARGPVARLRRALPSAWEPQIRRVASVPLLRDVYRRLTGLNALRPGAARRRGSAGRGPWKAHSAR